MAYSKESACSAGESGWSLGWEDPLEKEVAIHFSILAWEIPQTEEPGGLESMRSQEYDITKWLNHHYHLLYYISGIK